MAQAGSAIALNDELRRARDAEAAHFEALAAFNDAKSLRLRALKDEFATESFELSLTPGETPRLWIDLVSSIVMEPDPKTYRVVQDGQSLFETADRAEMVAWVRRFAAHGMIARARQKAQLRLKRRTGGGYSTASLFLAGATGFALGAMVLLALLTL